MTGLASLAAVALVWFGMVVAIAIEARAKFGASSLTRTVALDVGRHVFAALNKAELVLALLALGLAVWQRPDLRTWVALGVALAVLALQTAWLLPALSARAAQIIAGGTPPGSHAHVVYIAAEAVKLGALALTAHWALAARAA